MAKSNIVHLGGGIYEMDGVKYDTSKTETALTSWKCPHCGKTKLIYDLKLTEAEHYPVCKKLKKKKRLSKKAASTLKDLGII